MTSNLTWEPVRRKRKDLPIDLKFILRKRFGGTISNLCLDEDNLDYFRALADADVKGAQAVIDAIEKHGEIVLNEEF